MHLSTPMIRSRSVLTFTLGQINAWAGKQESPVELKVARENFGCACVNCEALNNIRSVQSLKLAYRTKDKVEEWWLFHEQCVIPDGMKQVKLTPLKILEKIRHVPGISFIQTKKPR